ncbi:MAG: helix-turn-helix domain-containing protein, partial [Candidatus Kapaibacterium sp.]
MTPQHPISTRLREARVARNISTSELQARARIREHLIEAIDEGRFDELPSVYMRSFLRRYAEHVGVPPQEMEDLISRHLDADGAHAAKGTSRLLPFFGASETPSVSRLPVEGSNNRRRILIFLVSLFGIACLSGIYLLLRGPSDGTSSTDRQNLLR